MPLSFARIPSTTKLTPSPKCFSSIISGNAKAEQLQNELVDNSNYFEISLVHSNR